jgi:hypothetical protein
LIAFGSLAALFPFFHAINKRTTWALLASAITALVRTFRPVIHI